MNYPESKLVPISDITLGDRFREEYGDLEALATSIKEQGLINPITIGLNPNAEESKKHYVLAAGGRRMAAYALIAKNNPEYRSIPCSVYDRILSDLELRSIELEENIRRKDFSYAEEVRLKQEVHKLRTAIHGEKVSRDDSEGWSQRDTAKLFGKGEASMSQDLQLAKAFAQFPELGLDKMKNKTDAMKMLKKVGSVIGNQIAAEEFEKNNAKGDRVLKNLANAYVLKDFFDGVSKVPSETVDLCEVDPPYAIKLQKQKKGYQSEGYNEVPEADYMSFMRKTIQECWRVLRPNGWLILWFGPDPWFEPLLQMLRDAQLICPGIPCIWSKGSGQTNSPSTRLASSYEMFFYARKGTPGICKPGRANVFNYTPVPHQHKIHPTERPIDLISDIFETFTDVNSNIMVPFLGSGNSILAAHKVHMKAFGFELNSGYKDAYIARLTEVVKGLQDVQE